MMSSAIEKSNKQVDGLELSMVLNCQPKLSGITLPGKLRLIMYRSDRKTFSALSKKYKISKQIISYVVQGQRKSKRIEEILATELNLTLSEIQEIIREHHFRISANNPITDQELFDWYRSYRAKCQGVAIEEIKSREYVSRFPIGYFIKKSKRDWYYRNRNGSVA